MKRKDSVNRIFRALADPTRRQIFHLLVMATSALSLTQLAEQVNLTRQGATKHVKILEMAGMVRTSEQGRERFCMANLAALSEIRDWLSFYDKFWDASLRRLDNFLANS